jgi:hypothetical protein
MQIIDLLSAKSPALTQINMETPSLISQGYATLLAPPVSSKET